MTDHVFGNEFLVATFADERGLLSAVRAVRARGLRVHDVYSPYPVHHLDDALGIAPSRLPIATLAGGVLGLLASLSFQFYAAVFDWPLNVGGKPDNSTLAFLPVAFEITVLGAGLATVAALLLRSGLSPTVHVPVIEPSATDDLFALVLRRRHIAFDPQVEHVLYEHGASRVGRQEFTP